MAYVVLNDNDIKDVLTMPLALNRVEATIREHGEGMLIAPPRFRVETENGGLAFTVGVAKSEHLIGFRVYDTIRHSYTDNAQITAIFDSETGTLRGIIIGKTIGTMRTGAIGGVAIKYMAREDAEVLGIIGAGIQARTQVEAAAYVRKFKRVHVFSPSLVNRQLFAREMSDRLNLAIEPVETAEQAVRGADVLICATTSRQPVFHRDWLSAGVHINTIGPKFRYEQEIDPDVLERCAVIATDSLTQLDHYDKPFFIDGTPYRAKMIELGAIVAHQEKGRQSAGDITLFCSVGLAGTEVVIADAVITAFQQNMGMPGSTLSF